MTHHALIKWPYGPDKYKDKKMEDLPSKFLRWIAENSFNDRLATAADQEWAFREKFNEHWEDEDGN